MIAKAVRKAAKAAGKESADKALRAVKTSDANKPKAGDRPGGGANVNLSSELDRLTRMIKLQREGRADRFNINISGTAQPGQPGILGSSGTSAARHTGDASCTPITSATISGSGGTQSLVAASKTVAGGQ